MLISRFQSSVAPALRRQRRRVLPCTQIRKELSNLACRGLPNCLEDRQWLLQSPETKLQEIQLSRDRHFNLVRDDLLHPILGGNKLRKLDALLPRLSAEGVTDVVTCGGVQSAHTAAVASACAERGMRAHLLIRGERPAVPTGYNLLARMFGAVTYVTRLEYSDRETILEKHRALITTQIPDSKVYVLAEGAAEPHSLLGLIRLIHYLATSCLDPDKSNTIIVDSGTGTTATGLAIGIHLLDLPWSVKGVTLAGPASYYLQQQHNLEKAFHTSFGVTVKDLPLEWVERMRPRPFGKVFPEEISTCSQIAKQHGVLLDPIYTLSAWELCCHMAGKNIDKHEGSIVMLHTGGSAGLYGLAQRFPDSF